MPLRVETIMPSPALSDAEAALLRRAFEGWDSVDAFSDAEVAEVKALFARVFGVEDAARLAGHTIADALLLRERDGCVPYYAAVCSDNAAWTWQRVDVLPDGDRVLMRSEILDPSLPFATMLILLGHS
jgi:hypothetical protein